MVKLVIEVRVVLPRGTLPGRPDGSSQARLVRV